MSLKITQNDFRQRVSCWVFFLCLCVVTIRVTRRRLLQNFTKKMLNHSQEIEKPKKKQKKWAKITRNAPSPGVDDRFKLFYACDRLSNASKVHMQSFGEKYSAIFKK